VANNSDFTIAANKTIDSMTGTGTTVLSGILTIGDGDNTSATYAGIASGTGGLTKAGTGTLTLTGANTFAGAVAINAGVLNVQNNTALGTVAGGVTVANGAALELQGGITVGAETLSLTGTGIGGNGALRNVSGSNIYGGVITLTAASSIGGAGTLTQNGTVTGSQDLVISGTLNTLFNAALGSPAAIGDGVGAAITINSTGTTEFASTVTTASGVTQSGGAGEVTFRDNVSIGAGDTASTFNANVVLDGLTFDTQGAVTFGDAGTDTLTVSTALATVDTVTNNTAIDVNSATTLSSDLTLTSGNALISLDGTVNGNNNLILNTTGTTDINGIIGDSTPITSITTNAGGTTEIGANISVNAGGMSFNDAVTQSSNITLTSASSPISFASTINGGANALTLNSGAGGAITVTGAASNISTLTITDSASSTFTGAVQATTVALTDTTGAITFNNNLTATTLTSDANGHSVILNGAATTVTNAVTFNNTGGVTLGNGGDALTFNGALTSTASTTSTGGTITVNGGNLALGVTNLNSATTIDLNGDANLLTYTSIAGATNLTIAVDGSLSEAAGSSLDNTINIGAATLDVTVDANDNGSETLDVGSAITAATINYSGTSNNDNIIGPDLTNTWVITGTNVGTLNGNANVDNFNNWTGGSGNDTFDFNGGTITGNVDGLAGTDTLDYATAAGPINVTLTALGSVDGFAGTASFITGSFDNMDAADGSSSASDSFQTPNISGGVTRANNSSYVNGNRFDFDAIENLIGGTGDDRFDIVANHAGNITDLGGNDTINFNAGTLNGNIALAAGNNVYDFNGGTHTGNVLVVGTDTWNHQNGVQLAQGGAITGTGNLTIPNSDNPSDLTINAVGLNLSNLTAFAGHLVVGGSIDSADLPLDGNKTINVNTSRLTLDSNLTTESDISLLGQDVDLNANIQAGGLGVAAGGKQLLIMATGDGSGNDTTGNITGVAIPTNIQAGNIILVAATNVLQAENIEIELAGGDALVSIATGQEAPQFALFDANAIEGDADIAAFLALDVNVAGIGAVLLNIEVTQDVGQANLAGSLIGLEQLAFIDVGLFEEDLSLFGVIGSGVALSLAQCEEVEGCAPDVTESELDELIVALHARIDELEKRKAESSGVDLSKIEELLAGYRKELSNFEGYKQQLLEYYSGDAEDDFEDDDFGDEAAPTIGDQIQSLGQVLEVAQRRIEWLEGLKADPESRATLSESTDIDLTIEAIDAIIEATRQEVLFIEKQIQLLQDGTQALSKPVFWAESGDYNGIHHVDYGTSLLSIGLDSVALNDKMY